MRRRLALCLMGMLSVVVALAAVWLCLPSGLSYLNYLRIREGMTVEEVEHLLGGLGTEIADVPGVVDWTVPVDSPQRIKAVIQGERFIQWSEFPDEIVKGKHIIIGIVNGKVKEKYYWSPWP